MMVETAEMPPLVMLALETVLALQPEQSEAEKE
jgi:hypothetical protein